MERMIEVIFDESIGSNQCYDAIDYYEMSRLVNIEIRASIECYCDSKVYHYIILENTEKEIYENILETNNILYICRDITEDSLNNLNLDILFFINHNLDSENHLNYQIFKDEYLSWIYENLSIDIILDRINLYGMENLRDIEYEFLDNNQ